MTPKLKAIRKKLPKALAELNRDNARAILKASQPLVPVDTGSLKDSGRVEKGNGTAAKLVYGGGGFKNRRTGRVIDYAGYVHNRTDVKHTRGQAQFVGQPLRTERLKRRKATAKAVSKLLKGA